MTGATRLVLCAALAFGGAGCAAAHGGPVLGAGEGPPEMSGTISGVVRAAGTNTPLGTRRVTAINVVTGAKYEASTAANGGYTLKVPIGRYRLEVELKPDESLADAPDVIEINRSDLDSGRDFVVTVKP